MASAFTRFQKIARNAHKHTIESTDSDSETLHPYDERNVHPDLDKISRKLFDDGHYSNATFEAFKYLDKKVQKLSGSRKSGFQLMMQAFNEASPMIKLTDLSNQSEIDEQHGYKFIFSGAVMAIRNPRGLSLIHI